MNYVYWICAVVFVAAPAFVFGVSVGYGKGLHDAVKSFNDGMAKAAHDLEEK